MHSLGAILALIVISVSALVLLVLGVMMIIGAVMPKRSVITSWPMQQEQAFTPFDDRNQGSSAKAWMFSIISGVSVFILAVGIYFGVKPDIKDIGKSMNMSNLTKKSKAEAPAPAPKTEAPKTEAPAPAPAPEAPPSEAPADDKK